ncbi:MAG: sodium-translocating pyrophosphatase [Chloroflexi bacterium RBG_13_51_36]|nr:MAG: sodium-translocating pyrophosphatase [Chloroflexi bacterium RBG_13_51_36]
MDLVWICVIVGIVGAAVVAYFVRYVLRQDEGSAKLKEISGAIKEGGLAFIHREYRTLAIVVVVVAIILAVVPALGWRMAVAFIFGALCSMGAGYAGMNMALRTNGRTCAASQKSLNQGLRVSFRGGAVMGLTVVSIGIIGLSILYFIWHDLPDYQFLYIIPAYGTGASLVALFARVGGGIFTKGADAGSDLVGKVEAGIPEDDPRNAAVIADNVGDNVGDVCGMGADLFESYVETAVGTMTLTTVGVLLAPWVKGVLFPSLSPEVALRHAWWLPLLIMAAGIVASVIGCFLVRVGEKVEMSALLGALRRGTLGATILAAVFGFLVIRFLGASLGLFWAMLAGLVAGALMGEATNYFTSYAFKPTQEISEASTRGAGATIIRGFANGLMSTWPPVVLVAVAIIIAYKFGSFYGVALAAVGMLSTLGVTLATDAYGPIADNAGGIATQAALPPEVRERTDALDSLGNTTAATGKGFAIGAAVMNALGLILAYAMAVGIVTISSTGQLNPLPPELSLLSTPIIVGLILGALIPPVFCAMSMKAVGITTAAIVDEVRRQWREIKGLMEGTARPEYGKCVDIATRIALKEMLVPSIMTIVAPVIVGVVLGKYALAGFLVGALATGFILAITLNNAGGAWDNAKKWIESGKFGGKGSDAHKAAVVGDTAGDPMKDTAGPSLNIMLKLMSVISLMLAPVLMHFGGLI